MCKKSKYRTQIYKYIKDEENEYKCDQTITRSKNYCPCECCDGYLPIVINDNVPEELLGYVFTKNFESNIMFV